MSRQKSIAKERLWQQGKGRPVSDMPGDAKMKGGVLSKPRRRLFATLAGGAALLSVVVYALTAGRAPAWAWQATGLIALAGLGVLTRSIRRPADRAPSRVKAQDAAQRGLRIAVCSVGIDAFRVSLHALPISADTKLLLLAGTKQLPVSKAELQSLWSRVRPICATSQLAAARLLELLAGRHDLEYALIALWQGHDEIMSYVSLGLGPVTISRTRRQQEDQASCTTFRCGRRKAMLGVRHLSPGEHWLLHTGPPGAPGRRRQLLGSVESARCARHRQQAPDSFRGGRLLERGREAGGRALPEGASLVSITGEQPP